MDFERIARMARRTAKALERENKILQDEPRGPIIHEPGASEIGEWEGPGIPIEEYEDVSKMRKDKPEEYDIWSIVENITNGS